jgi:excisionase family DNA binding protein
LTIGSIPDYEGGGRLPDLLTVEEAALVLRIGRTAAYELARRFRATDGRDGIPVIAVGRQLRVPRTQLEALVGAELTDPRATRLQPSLVSAPTTISRTSEPRPEPDRRPSTRSSRRRPRVATTNQLDLFGSDTAAS